jgi:hypothetical protein
MTAYLIGLSAEKNEGDPHQPARLSGRDDPNCRNIERGGKKHVTTVPVFRRFAGREDGRGFG